MPITINDCHKCGKPPQVGFNTLDAWEGVYDVVFFCKNSKCKVEEGQGEDFISAVEDWNKNHGEDKR